MIYFIETGNWENGTGHQKTIYFLRPLALNPLPSAFEKEAIVMTSSDNVLELTKSE